MWPIISISLEILVGVIVVTQILVPIVLNYPLFWIFKRKVSLEQDEEEPSLNDELSSAKEVAEEAKKKVNEVREKVDKHYRKAEEMKDAADDLL